MHQVSCVFAPQVFVGFVSVGQTLLSDAVVFYKDWQCFFFCLTAQPSVENARRNTFPKYSQFYSSDHNQQHSTQLDRSLTKSDRCKVHYSAITQFLVGVKLSSIIKVIK